MKKNFYYFSIFLLVGMFGIVNVNALTQFVNNEGEFYDAINESTIETVKLNSDVTIDTNKIIMHSSSLKKVIDLNGHTLTTSSGLSFEIYGSYLNFEVVITDTSSSQSGKLQSLVSSTDALNFLTNVENKFTLKIENIEFNSNLKNSNLFFVSGTSGYNIPSFEFFSKNVKASGAYKLLRTQRTNATSINLENFEYLKNHTSSGIFLYNDSQKSFSELFDSNTQDLFIDGILQEDLTVLSKDVNANYSFKIKNKTALTAEAINIGDVEIGWGETSYDLKITNNFSSDVTLNSVTLSNDTGFKIGGVLPVTISGNNFNDSLKVITRAGLAAGHYTSTIIGTDTLGNTYDLGTVSFNVKKKTNNATISMADWTYGESASEPNITNNDSSNQPTFKYRNSSGVWSDDIPTIPGNYILKVMIDGDDTFLDFDDETNFEILKKGIFITDVTITSKPYNYNSPELTNDLVNYSETIPGVTEVRLINLHDSGGGTLLNVGTDFADVYFIIKESQRDYYLFEGNDNPIQLIKENVQYTILEGENNFILNDPNIGDIDMTTLFIKSGESLDLSGHFNLDVDFFKNKVIATIPTPYPGLSLDGLQLNATTNASAGKIEINLLLPAFDNNNDGNNEYPQVNKKIYVEIIEKIPLTIEGLTDNQVFTYNGSPYTPLGTLTIQDGLVQVSDLETIYYGINSTSYNSPDAPTNAGEYKVTYKIPNTNPIYVGSVTYNFTIKKATPLLPAVDELEGIFGNLLNTVSLPDGYSWHVPTTTMNMAGIQTYEAIYTPSDIDNFIIVENISINVLVKKEYSLTTESLGNGNVLPPILEILDGSLVEIEFMPDPGYEIDEVKVNGVVTNVTDNTLELIINEDTHVVVSFKKEIYSINILDYDPKGVTVTPSGLVHLEYGSNLEILIDVNPAYRLLYVKVNDIDRTKDMILNKLVLENISANQTIEILVEEIIDDSTNTTTNKNIGTNSGQGTGTSTGSGISYSFTEGSDQEIILSNKKDAIFEINALFSLFKEIRVDDTLLDPTNYTVTEGSTIVTLKESYLKTLKEGKYTLKVLFKDGGVAKTTFSIANSAAIENAKADESNNTWCYIISGIVILIAIITFVVLFKRYKERKN